MRGTSVLFMELLLNFLCFPDLIQEEAATNKKDLLSWQREGYFGDWGLRSMEEMYVSLNFLVQFVNAFVIQVLKLM